MTILVGILTPLQLVIHMIHLLILYMVDHNLPVDIVVTGGQKNWSFASNSGIPQLIWSKFGVGAQVKGRQRSGNLGGGAIGLVEAKLGARTTPMQPGVFGSPNQMTLKIFHLGGYLLPKTSKLKGLNRYLTAYQPRRTLQRDTVHSTL